MGLHPCLFCFLFLRFVGCSILEPPTSVPSLEPSFTSYANMIPTPKPPLVYEDDNNVGGDTTGGAGNANDGGNSNSNNNIAVPSTGSSTNTKPKNDGDSVEGSSSGSTSGNQIPTTTLDTSRVGKNRLRAATIIAGVTLGAAGLCLMGIGSSRRFFRLPPAFLSSQFDDGNDHDHHLPPHELFESSDGISDMDDSIM